MRTVDGAGKAGLQSGVRLLVFACIDCAGKQLANAKVAGCWHLVEGRLVELQELPKFDTAGFDSCFQASLLDINKAPKTANVHLRGEWRMASSLFAEGLAGAAQSGRWRLVLLQLREVLGSKLRSVEICCRLVMTVLQGVPS